MDGPAPDQPLTTHGSTKPRTLRTAVEIVVRVGVLLILVGWCFWIVRPFIVAVLWGVILAVALHPTHLRLCARLGGRSSLAATLLTAAALLLLIGPLTLIMSNLVGNVAEIAQLLSEGRLIVPPPPPGIAGWPIIGEPLARVWTAASINLLSALNDLRPQLQALAGWFLALVAGAGLSILHAIAALVIAGILMAHAAGGHAVAEAIATRLVGRRGPGLADLAGHTIRDVVRGVLGTAAIQSTLAGVGFVIAGIPWAAVLTLVCFLLCIAQIGPALVLLGAVIFKFSTGSTLAAGVFLVWCLLVSLSDNVLKPLLMSRGSVVPLPVILAGVLGGLLAHGLIGLFVGPIVLALGYELFKVWLARRPAHIDDSDGPPS